MKYVSPYEQRAYRFEGKAWTRPQRTCEELDGKTWGVWLCAAWRMLESPRCHYIIADEIGKKLTKIRPTDPLGQYVAGRAGIPCMERKDWERGIRCLQNATTLIATR